MGSGGGKELFLSVARYKWPDNMKGNQRTNLVPAKLLNLSERASAGVSLPLLSFLDRVGFERKVSGVIWENIGEGGKKTGR